MLQCSIVRPIELDVLKSALPQPWLDETAGQFQVNCMDRKRETNLEATEAWSHHVAGVLCAIAISASALFFVF